MISGGENIALLRKFKTCRGCEDHSKIPRHRRPHRRSEGEGGRKSLISVCHSWDGEEGRGVRPSAKSKTLFEAKVGEELWPPFNLCQGENTSLPSLLLNHHMVWSIKQRWGARSVAFPKSCCLIRSILAASCPSEWLLLVLIAPTAGTLFAEHRQID